MACPDPNHRLRARLRRADGGRRVHRHERRAVRLRLGGPTDPDGPVSSHVRCRSPTFAGCSGVRDGRSVSAHECRSLRRLRAVARRRGAGEQGVKLRYDARPMTPRSKPQRRRQPGGETAGSASARVAGRQTAVRPVARGTGAASIVAQFGVPTVARAAASCGVGQERCPAFELLSRRRRLPSLASSWFRVHVGG